MLLLLRSSEKDVSLLELSVQAKLALLEVVEATMRLDGAAGLVGSVTTVVPEYAEYPAAL
jgi:hypothetical protein